MEDKFNANKKLQLTSMNTLPKTRYFIMRNELIYIKINASDQSWYKYKQLDYHLLASC